MSSLGSSPENDTKVYSEVANNPKVVFDFGAQERISSNGGAMLNADMASYVNSSEAIANKDIANSRIDENDYLEPVQYKTRRQSSEEYIYCTNSPISPTYAEIPASRRQNEIKDTDPADQSVPAGDGLTSGSPAGQSDVNPAGYYDDIQAPAVYEQLDRRGETTGKISVDGYSNGTPPADVETSQSYYAKIKIGETRGKARRGRNCLIVVAIVVAVTVICIGVALGVVFGLSGPESRTREMGSVNETIPGPEDEDGNVTEITRCGRFHTGKNSRWEYNTILYSSLFTSVSVNLLFKTSASDGVLLYAVDGDVPALGLYMKNRKIVTSTKLDSVIFTSVKDYDDSQWHLVVLVYSYRYVEIYIDGNSGEHLKDYHSALTSVTSVYVGGVANATAQHIQNNTQGVSDSFDGYIKDLDIFGEYALPHINHQTEPCVGKVEASVFCWGDSYITASENLRVGGNISIQMTFRTRQRDGVLVSASKIRGDHLALEIVDETLRFAVDNGAGVIETNYTSQNGESISDGEWHTINALKSGNVVTMEVDGVSTDPGMGGGESFFNVDNDGSLYVCGLPGSKEGTGITTQGTFDGCIRNLAIEIYNTTLTISDLKESKHERASFNFCPKWILGGVLSQQL